MFNSNSCVKCGYSITDPVCKSCYIKQTKAYLKDEKINSITINFITDKIKNIFPSDTLNEIKCIICSKEYVSLCRYCFSVSTIRILKELNFSEKFIENFEYIPIHEEYEENSIFNESVYDNIRGIH